MFPELFHLGPFSLKTMSVFMMIAFLMASFIFWRRGKEEHYKEDQLFDGYLLSILVGLVAARVGFVLISLSQLGLAPLKWLDIFSHPGFSGWAGLVGGGLYLKKFAKESKWDVYEILDFAVTAISFGAVFMWLGRFFEGTSMGLPTSLPWGVQFPTVLEPHHPVQLYFAVFYVLLFWYLTWVEYHYRTFAWYRIGKRTAQTGFITSVFVIGSSLASLVFSLMQPPGTVVMGVQVSQFLSIATLLFGMMLLYVRSGRALPFSREHKKRKVLQQRFVS